MQIFRLILICFALVSALAQAQEAVVAAPAGEAPAPTSEVPPATVEVPTPSPVAPLATPAAGAEATQSIPTPLERVTVHGQLREKGTRKPLGNVNVYCFSPPENPLPLKTVTDTQGGFSIDVPKGPLRWKVSLSNYAVFEHQDDSPNVQTAPRFYLEKKSYLVYETTVFGQGDKRDDKTQSLTQDQFMTLPGSNGDPVKAVQNLPGVNRANAFSAQVIIEGSSPSDTRYNIDTQPVPIIFHFGGLSSVVMPEAVERVDYLSAGFGPEFGGTTAGLVNLATADPKTDRAHGMGFVDLYNVGAMVETPVDDHSSFLVGFRKSYIGAVLGAVARNNSKGQFDLTVAPDFDDAVMEYTNQLNANDRFKLTAVGSIDTLGFILPEPPDQDPSLRGNFNETVSFFRLIPQFTHKFDENSSGHVWMGIGQDSTIEDFGNIYYRDRANVFSQRFEYESQVNKTWKSYVGLDNVITSSKLDFQVPYSPGGQAGSDTPLAESSLLTVSKTYNQDEGGLYWRNIVHDESSRWSFLPGARLGYDSLTKKLLPEPRLGTRYKLNHGLTLRAATGLYDEAPPVQYTDPGFGNPNLQDQYAVHYTAGFEKDFRGADSAGWIWSTDMFYKRLYNLVQSTANLNSAGQPEYYDNQGRGRIYGAEFMLKYQGRAWSGWLAYTLSRSLRTYPPASEQIYEYDQTHNLILVGEREFGHNWKFSGRFRFTSGDPYTPITGGAYDVDNDVYAPVSGAGVFSQRMPAFYEVDIRFDKKWVFERWILTGYLDVENVTNHKNVEQINYSYDYQQHTTVNGLPMLPTLGIKGEF